jgi:hypothetical protein
MRRSLIGLTFCVALAATATLPAEAQRPSGKPPVNWDGLTQVKAKRFDLVYLMPGADFKPYKRIMLDPTEVAFRKNWARDYNSTTRDLSRRIKDDDVVKAMELVKVGFQEEFANAYRKAGYQVVNTPAPDVMRVRTAVINLEVYAPDRPTAGRSESFSSDAGQATLVLEIRDSMSGALMGRAVDARLAGESAPFRRNSLTNRSDFRQLFATWAKISLQGLEELKTSGAPR